MAANHHPADPSSPAIHAVVGAAPPHTRGALGPYSRVIDRGALGSAINGSSREGRFLRAYESQLWEHCGGDPSIVQRALIVRAARLALHLELMDERSLAGQHEFTTHDHLHYVSWSNALARLLGRLGLVPAAGKPTDPLQAIHNHIARRQAAGSEAA